MKIAWRSLIATGRPRPQDPEEQEGAEREEEGRARVAQRDARVVFGPGVHGRRGDFEVCLWRGEARGERAVHDGRRGVCGGLFAGDGFLSSAHRGEPSVGGVLPDGGPGELALRHVRPRWISTGHGVGGGGPVAFVRGGRLRGAVLPDRGRRRPREFRYRQGGRREQRGAPR